MSTYYGYDAHKRYSIFTFVDDTGTPGPYVRVENERSLFRGYLKMIPPPFQIAAETVGNWYWMVHEKEKSLTFTPYPFADECGEGQGHDGPDQQDGQARRQEAGSSASERDSSLDLDSAGRAA